jgi:hypothetical protein
MGGFLRQAQSPLGLIGTLGAKAGEAPISSLRNCYRFPACGAIHVGWPPARLRAA